MISVMSRTVTTDYDFRFVIYLPTLGFLLIPLVDQPFRYKNTTILTYFSCKLVTPSANFQVDAWNLEKMVCSNRLFICTFCTAAIFFVDSVLGELCYVLQKLKAWRESWPVSLEAIPLVLYLIGRYYPGFIFISLTDSDRIFMYR